MLEAQVVPSLMKWGVSPHADLVYRTLITFGPWSVDSISRSLEMRSRQVRTALDELSGLGAAAPERAVAAGARAGDDRLWSGRAPAHVLSLLHDRHHRAALARERAHQRLIRVSYPSLVADPARIPAGGARPLEGLERTMERIAAVSATERHENLAMNPEPSFNAAQIKQAAPLERQTLARGVTVLSLGVPASAEDESDWHDEEMRSHGLYYRELPEVPGKLLIIDRATAFIRLDPANRARGMWEITEPGVVAELVSLFLEQWARATEPGRFWNPPAGLSPRESTVVVMLAMGYTDTAIASKLDISVRTIAYTLSALMDRYDVTNRFQLGLRLGAEAARQAPGEPNGHETNGE
ncbi:helix-turn-helix transcriptional regulator [Catellatospora vulcania]|uniref:helix-turn-helix transcriptional regulator n=1 Tax=Catellatospora vulcania TaxID=1460450 RepID=UPI0012D4AFCB|nr:helix-turn-helix transcriptional regulator [Catellatospora vulcania]